MALKLPQLWIVAVMLIGQLHPNVSIGGTDTSSNSVGVQARWDDGGSFAGVFVGGTTLDAVANGKWPDGRSALVVAVAEQGVDAGLFTYLWTPRVEQTISGTQVLPGNAGSERARALLRRAAARFHGMHVSLSSGDSHAPVARTSAPSPQRGAGSTLSGLPAVSVDPHANTIQAGWLEGTRRYGVLARGRWHMAAGASLASDERGDWLVAFELDQSTGRVTLLQAVHGPAGVEIGHSVDGESRPFVTASSPWVARAVEWVARHR